MTMSPVEVERRVRRLDNDVQSIYELLLTIQSTQVRQGNRIDEIDDKLTLLEAKLTAHDDRFSTIDTKLDTVLEVLRQR